jgi:Ca2+-binding EF-hand superfamily protein
VQWCSAASARVKKHSFLILDFVVIVVSVGDLLLTSGVIDIGDQKLGVAALRFFRILRVVRFLKMFRYVKELYMLLNAFLNAFRTLIWVMCMILLLIYIFAIYATRLLARYDEKFATLEKSMWNFFVILTLEGWPDELASFSPAEHPDRGVHLFCLLVFILLGHFLIMNLFVAVIVENVTSASSTSDMDLMQSLHARRNFTVNTMVDMFDSVDRDKTGQLSLNEFVEFFDGGMPELLKVLGIGEDELDWLFRILDRDGNEELDIDELLAGLLAVQGSELTRQLFRMQYSVMKEVKMLKASIATNSVDQLLARTAEMHRELESMSPNFEGLSNHEKRQGSLEALRNAAGCLRMAQASERYACRGWLATVSWCHLPGNCFFG